MPQLLRDNTEDSRVARDVELLAGAYNEEAVAEAAAAATAARQADLTLLAASYQPEADVEADVRPPLPSWRPVLTHVNRYRTLYATAAFVLGVFLFRSPVPLPTLAAGEAANTAIPTADAAPAGAPAGVAIPDEAYPSAAGDFPAALPDDFSAAFDAGAVSTEAPSSSFARPAAPVTLRISQSGYASTFGGTPLEQAPPGNGLPAQLTAGQVTKASFVRLSGGGRTLRLTMLTANGANTNDGAAQVEACHITTAGWSPARGIPMNQAPKYDTNDCVQGSRNGAVWTFTFVLDNPLDSNGWALVPIGANATFQVTFSPSAG